MGMGRGRPLPKFFGTLAFKKSGTSCPNWGEGGGRGNLDKIQKNSYFFFVKPTLRGRWTNLAVWSSVGCFKAPLTGSITTPKPEISADDPSCV